MLLRKQHSKEHPDNVILFSDKMCVCVCVYELSNHEKTWRKLECILLSESSLSEKATYHMNPTICYSGKGKTMKTVKRSVVARS